MSNSYINDFRSNVFAAGKRVMTKESNRSTNQPQLNPLRRVTRALTRACNEAEQVGPVFFILCSTKITVKLPSCW
jgi:hypothetical protein